MFPCCFLGGSQVFLGVPKCFPGVSLVVFQGFSEVFLKFPPSVSQVLLRLFLGLSLVVPKFLLFVLSVS